MVVERDAAAVLEPAGGRLADVVQQGGQPQHEVGTGDRSVRSGLERDRLLQHGERVLVDVLVPVVLVDREPQRRDLGQHLVGQPGVDQQLQARPRVRPEQQLHQLGHHPLAGDDLEPAGHLGHRRAGAGLDVEAELGGEPRHPQHPQRVVAERLLRRDGRAQQPPGQVVQRRRRGRRR